MVRALLAVLLLIPQAPPQEAELSALLDRMEAKRKGLQDLRATVSTYLPLQLKTGITDLRRWTTASLVYRAPGDAAWTVKKDRADFFHGNYLDQAKGVKAAIHGDTFLLHAPTVLHLPRDGPGRGQNYPYGATWFKNHLLGDSPGVLPMLAREPEEFPVALLFDLAPRRYLSLLPSLRLRTKRKEAGREFAIIDARPPLNDGARKEEAARAWNYDTWMFAEFWVDLREARIDRMTFEYEACSSGPRVRSVREYRIARRENAAGLPDFPTSIGLYFTLEDRPAVPSRIDLSDLKVNAGVSEEEVTLRPPPERIVRDWIVQSPEMYAKEPSDPGSWLGLGVVRQHAFDSTGAEKAFRKVIELRPAAEEGYAALSVVLEKTKSPDAWEVFEKGAAATKSDLVRWIQARRITDPVAARKQLESLRSTKIDPQKINDAIAEPYFNDPEHLRPLCVQAMKLEIAGGTATWLWHHWKQAKPSDKERQEILKLCEDGLKKEDRLQLRLRTIDLCAELGKKDDVKKHAKAILALLEKKPSEADWRTVDRIHEVFRAEKDAESLRRLDKAFAGRDDDDGDLIRLILEAERQVAEGNVEGWIRYFDEKIAPLEKHKFEVSWEPGQHFFIALRREKKLIPFLERLFLTPKDDENFNFHRFAATTIPLKMLEGSERTEFQIRLRELEKGAAGAATGQELLGIAQQMVTEKKWAEARAKAEAVLATKDASGPTRCEAWRTLARSLQGSGDYVAAAAACTKALAEKDGRFHEWIHSLKFQVLVSANDLTGAVTSLGEAFEELEKEPGHARRWRLLWYLLKEVPTSVKDSLVRLKLRDAANSLAGNPSPGMQAAIGLMRELQGDYKGAAEAYARARAVWKDDPLLARWHMRAATRALQLDLAMSLRGELIVLIKAEEKNLPDYTLASMGILDLELYNTCCELLKDPVAARKFARILAAETITDDNSTILGALLAYLKDEAFIDEMDALRVKRALEEPDENRSLYAHYAACYAWHKLGKTDKALAVYREVTEENGWSKRSVDIARAWIAQWEKERKP